MTIWTSHIINHNLYNSYLNCGYLLRFNALGKSERRFRTLFQQAAVGVAELDPETGRFLDVNQWYCNMVGRSREEMLGTDFQSITHPDDLEADLNQMSALRRGEIGPYTMEKRYLRKNGEIIWVSLTVYPICYRVKSRPGTSP